MKQKVKLILLRTTRYNDRNDIALGLTREIGAVSFLVSARSGRSASRQRAMLMPMSVVEGELNLPGGRSIGTFGDLSILIPLQGVYANPLKSSIAMFMADFMAAVVREGSADTALWDFTAASLEALNGLSSARVANFPLVFVMTMAEMLGIAPDSATYCRGRILDLRDGIYRTMFPIHPDIANAAESRMIALIGRMDYSNMHRLKLNRDTRNLILDGMLRFITMHHTKVDSLRTLPVLRTLF
ncbi:MAG: hypothetical protein HDR92_06740 [Bacteroides sp.]|nr:hypothetical protein [Bacteroides sp.]